MALRPTVVYTFVGELLDLHIGTPIEDTPERLGDIMSNASVLNSYYVMSVSQHEILRRTAGVRLPACREPLTR